MSGVAADERHAIGRLGREESAQARAVGVFHELNERCGVLPIAPPDGRLPPQFAASMPPSSERWNPLGKMPPNRSC